MSDISHPYSHYISGLSAFPGSSGILFGLDPDFEEHEPFYHTNSRAYDLIIGRCAEARPDGNAQIIPGKCCTLLQFEYEEEAVWSKLMQGADENITLSFASWCAHEARSHALYQGKKNHKVTISDPLMTDIQQSRLAIRSLKPVTSLPAVLSTYRNFAAEISTPSYSPLNAHVESGLHASADEIQAVADMISQPDIDPANITHAMAIQSNMILSPEGQVMILPSGDNDDTNGWVLAVFTRERCIMLDHSTRLEDTINALSLIDRCYILPYIQNKASALANNENPFHYGKCNLQLWDRPAEFGCYPSSN